MTNPALRELSVFFQGRLAGKLSVDRGGAMKFAYAP